MPPPEMASKYIFDTGDIEGIRKALQNLVKERKVSVSPMYYKNITKIITIIININN